MESEQVLAEKGLDLDSGEALYECDGCHIDIVRTVEPTACPLCGADSFTLLAE